MTRLTIGFMVYPRATPVILKNAVTSIRLGVEDYKSTGPSRVISCTRNIVAGILLLFKYKLAELSPKGSDEVLIKKRIIPQLDVAGKLTWRGEGRKTVDVQEIKDRFTTLGIAVDWKRVDAIIHYRNEVEHYYSSQPASAALRLIADSFIVIRDFVRAHLEMDPRELLGDEVWSVLTDVNEVYEKEKRECIQRIESIDWRHDSLKESLMKCNCKECGSGLIDVVEVGVDRDDAEFECRSCGTTWGFAPMLHWAVADAFAYENHRESTDGGYPGLIDCPECGEPTYVVADNVCVLCESSFSRECWRCSNDIPVEELDDSGLCGWCAHMASKED